MSIYRQYEDPYKVQQWLEEAEARYEQAKAEGADEDRLVDLYLDVYALRERLNFAWQDEEAAELGID